MNILIRTSGGKAPKKELSFGHIYRTSNLADNFQNHKIFFLIEDYGGAKKILFAREHKNVSRLKKGICLKEDIEKTQKFITKHNIDLLIIDKYHLKQKYVEKIKKYVTTVVISDLKNIEYPADLIVNGFIGYNNVIRKNSFGSRCLLGPQYQILNKEFSKSNKKKKKIDLLATFGGFDESNVIEKLLSTLEDYHKKIITRIILGPGTPHSKKIRDYERKYGMHLQVIQTTKSMRNEILSAKFGICAGGITTYEFAACNTPFSIVSQVKHQLTTAREWQKKGIALDLGLVNNRTKNKIESFLELIINNQLHSAKRQIVDGLGAKRVTHEIIKIKSFE